MVVLVVAGKLQDLEWKPAIDNHRHRLSLTHATSYWITLTAAPNNATQSLNVAISLKPSYRKQGQVEVEEAAAVTEGPKITSLY